MGKDPSRLALSPDGEPAANFAAEECVQNAPDEGAVEERSADLDNLSIILVHPQHSGNIGSAARAMKNMGVTRLILVRPHAPLDDTSFQMARGAMDVLRASRDVGDIAEALEGVAITAATTARTGRRRRESMTPRDLAALLAPLTLRNKVAILFGPERTGLHNDVIERCQWVVNIPTFGQFRSLNLAQAVLILCYELLLASFPKPSRTRALAAEEQLNDMYSHIRETLLKVGFLDPNNPERMLMVLRRIFARAGLDRREVQIIRGIMRQIDWYRRTAAPIGTPHPSQPRE